MPDDEVQAQPDWLGSALAKIGDLPTRLNQAAIDEGAAYRGRVASEQPQVPETPSFGYGMVEPITQLSPQPQPPYDYYGANLESGRNLSRQSFVDSYNKQATAEPRVAPLNAIASALAGRPVTPYNANPSNYRQLSPSEEAERQRATQSEYAGLAAGIATPELASAMGLARFAPGPNQLNIFLPARAKQVKIASELEDQGVHPDSILKQTGAFRDVDGMWKREISDANARVIPSEEFLNKYEGAGGPAEAMFEHEKLYKELPSLKKHQIDYGLEPEFQKATPQDAQTATGWEKAGYSPEEIFAAGFKRSPDGEWLSKTHPTGAYRPTQKLISASGYNPEQLRTSTLHEMQHAVDTAKGIPSGTGLATTRAELSKLSPFDIEQEAEKARQLGSRWAPHPENYEGNWEGYLNQLAADRYWRNQGEVRARNVETRRNMTDWERRNTHPFETMDVPPEQQIVGGRTSGVSRSEPAAPPSPPIQRSLDPLGYYSQALEAAKALPQAKGTPEQMLAQLKKAGVKDAEIQATNLPQFLEGKKSVTRDEIAQHLEDNRVGLNVTQYGSRDEHIQKDLALSAKNRELHQQLADLYAQGAYGPVDQAKIQAIREEINNNRIAQSRLVEEMPQSPNWNQYSLDPKNPTYRETVLHLPDKQQDAYDAYHNYENELRAKYNKPHGLDFEIPGTPEEMDKLRDLAEKNFQTGRDTFISGHFKEPNITGHLMTSMVKDKNGRNVFNVDQIQSDWGQKLREGGVRDETKIADLQQQIGDNELQLNELTRSLAEDVYGDANHYADPNYLKDDILRLPLKTNDPKFIGLLERLEQQKRLINDIDRMQAEFRTAKSAAQGHPLVNTTDQWVNTTLRHAIKQAAESGADAISIPSGDTVLSYNPGDKHGMNEFYGKIVPKNLGKLLKKLDPQSPPPETHDTLVTPTKGASGKGFVVFPLTDKLKHSVMKEGQPLFKRGGAVHRDDGGPVLPDDQRLNQPVQQAPAPQAKISEMPTYAGTLNPFEGKAGADYEPLLYGVPYLGAARMATRLPEVARTMERTEEAGRMPGIATNIYDQISALPSNLSNAWNNGLLSSRSRSESAYENERAKNAQLYAQDPQGYLQDVVSHAMYEPTGPGDAIAKDEYMRTVPLEVRDKAYRYILQAKGEPTPFETATTEAKKGDRLGPGGFETRVVPSQARGGTVTMDNSMTKGSDKPNQASSVNPEQNSFVPEHLPPHERSFLHNPDEAYERSKHLIPYLRAGGEAYKRGEDFFGGSDQYERELAALKNFYGSRQSSTAKTAPEAPTARKHGGSVHKKVVHIHDTFKQKLEGRERKISSMEKAQARKSNPMLSKRIDLEKKEVERMKQHIEKIKSHIS